MVINPQRVVKYQKHVYDVDLKAIYIGIKEQSDGAEPSFLLNDIEKQVELYCNAFGIKRGDFDIGYSQVVIHSSENLYMTYFPWALFLIDLAKIELFLDYHFEEFLGNDYERKDGFVGMVEHLVYDQLKKLTVSDTQNRLDRVMAWVRQNKDRKQLAEDNPLKLSVDPKELVPVIIELIKQKYVHEYYSNESRISDWIRTYLLKPISTGSVLSEDKLVWIASTSSLAEFLQCLIETKTLIYRKDDKAELYKWVERAISYNGKPSTLKTAFNSLGKLGANIFTCKPNSSGVFMFKVEHGARKSSKR